MKTAFKQVTTQRITSNQLVAFPIQLFAEQDSDIRVPSEIHVLPTGRWSHPLYGEMVITSEDISEFKRNFDAGLRKDLRITAGHEVFEELPAVAWIRELHDRGNEGLYATIEWTTEGKQLLMDRKFKYFSPEYFPVYEDAATQQKYRNVLSGGALTNQPFFKELDDVVTFSDGKRELLIFTNQDNIENGMNLEDILKKNADELSDDEKAFLKDNAASLSDDDKTKFESVLGDGAGDGDGDGEDDDKGDGDGGEGGEGGDGDGDGGQQQHSDKNKAVMISASELATLREQANAGFVAAQKVEKMELSEKVVSKMVFSSSNTTGRFAPKQKDAVTEFMFSLNKTQRDQFTNIVNNMPSVAASFSEKGDQGADAKNPRVELSELAATRVKEAKNAGRELKYSDAVREVLAERPDLQDAK